MLREKLIESVVFESGSTMEYITANISENLNRPAFIYDYDGKRYICAVIEGNDLCLFLIKELFVKEKESYGCSSLNREDFVNIPSEIEDNGTHYNVKYLYLRCQRWSLSLPASIQDVIIDRTPFISENSSKFPFGDSTSKFKVAKDNQYLCDDNYSLYSKNKEKLYHLHSNTPNLYSDENIKLSNELKTVLPEAIRGDFCGITFPKGVSTIMKNAIFGGFKSLDFQGKLTCIEKDALSNVNYYGPVKILHPFTIRINGLLNDLNSESRNELKNWKKRSYRNCIVFAAPKDLPISSPIAGYIHLAGIIEDNNSSKSRVDYDRDYKDVKLNTCIHSQIGESSLPIMIEEIKLENMYNPEEKGTRITFFTRDNCNKEQTAYVDVYETPDEVLRKIKEAEETH